MKCKYCNRKVPNKKWITSQGKKCIWCDSEYKENGGQDEKKDKK